MEITLHGLMHWDVILNTGLDLKKKKWQIFFLYRMLYAEKLKPIPANIKHNAGFTLDRAAMEMQRWVHKKLTKKVEL